MESAPHAGWLREARVAGAPISWGACEVPGWGLMPEPEHVLSEMAELGLRGTELGPPGFLPAAPDRLRATLARHGVELVGGFCPLVLHDRRFDVQAAQDACATLAQAGAGTLVLAVVQDVGWSRPEQLDGDGWGRLAEHVDELKQVAVACGLRVALHPHAGSLIKTAEQVERAMDELDVGWCLDTGHLLIGGTDPARFAEQHGDRVVHVHLKDVDASLAASMREGRETLLSATRQGLFLPLGSGDARIGAVLEALRAHGYGGWFVLEQDTAITGHEPTVQGGPMRDARDSIAFLLKSAPTLEVRT